LAQEYGTALVPFWLESIYQDPALFLDDRIHPTAAGIAALVEDTVDDVERVLPQE
ncbi:MAG TPA: arylesterase, partial [Erythrobacter sp.]|nr:arylesterase [Erythrobacter sp.]HAW36414.1 arylesterase [Erythrobacter sp.]HBM04097.1 arylesterase [Erythrobacter sp.]